MRPITTMLFVPGDRPDRIGKAAASAAAAITVDLEDAVAATRKDEARSGAVGGVRSSAPTSSCLMGIRVNAADSGHLEADLDSIAGIWEHLDYLVLPMVSDADTVRAVAAACGRIDTTAGAGGPKLIPLIETAAAVLAVAEIATATPRIHTLTFGPADLSRQLGVTPSSGGTELLHARSQLVLAAAAANLPAPIDGPWLALDDLDGLARSAAHAHQLGFGGKQVLHPKQIGTVEDVFTVSDQQRAWARTVDEAFRTAEAQGVASIKLTDGTFVDYPVAQRARDILSRPA